MFVPYSIKLYSLQAQLLHVWQGIYEGTLSHDTFAQHVDVSQHVRGDADGVRRSWTLCNYVFIPALICDDHWIACYVSFCDRHISVYDSSPWGHSKKEMKKALDPLCELIPYVLLQCGICADRPDLSKSPCPYQWEIVQDLPSQKTGSGDCGIFTCKFIDYVGLGRTVQFSSEQAPFLRVKMALEMYVGRLL